MYLFHWARGSCFGHFTPPSIFLLGPLPISSRSDCRGACEYFPEDPDLEVGDTAATLTFVYLLPGDCAASVSVKSRDVVAVGVHSNRRF